MYEFSPISDRIAKMKTHYRDTPFYQRPGLEYEILPVHTGQ
jgi:hypothetical protein